MAKTKYIAPIQMIVIGFEKPKFEGRIMNELNKLRDNKLIRIVDGLAVAKDKNGNLKVLGGTDLPIDEAIEYGAVIAGLIGLGPGDRATIREVAVDSAILVETEYEYGMDPDELEALTEDIPNGGAAIFLMIEHLWALPLKQSVRDAGGMLIAQDFLSPETLIGMGQEIFNTVNH